jgi:hypothetical protein
MYGSIPLRLNEDEDKLTLLRVPLDSQSPARCFMLQQLEQQIETVTCWEWVSWDGDFHKRSHSDSRCSLPQ